MSDTSAPLTSADVFTNRTKDLTMTSLWDGKDCTCMTGRKRTVNMLNTVLVQRLESAWKQLSLEGGGSPSKVASGMAADLESILRADPEFMSDAEAALYARTLDFEEGVFKDTPRPPLAKHGLQISTILSLEDDIADSIGATQQIEEQLNTLPKSMSAVTRILAVNASPGFTPTITCKYDDTEGSGHGGSDGRRPFHLTVKVEPSFSITGSGFVEIAEDLLKELQSIIDGCGLSFDPNVAAETDAWLTPTALPRNLWQFVSNAGPNRTKQVWEAYNKAKSQIESATKSATSDSHWVCRVHQTEIKPQPIIKIRSLTNPKLNEIISLQE